MNFDRKAVWSIARGWLAAILVVGCAVGSAPVRAASFQPLEIVTRNGVQVFSVEMATTEEEATFLSPLDPVSARGRAKPLFGFDYVWEIYKPVKKRSFGYYTMPILWGDRLVGRFDPKLDRTTGTLVINGLWLEDPALAKDEAFAAAMTRGAARFRAFHEAKRFDVAAVPKPLRRLLRTR